MKTASTTVLPPGELECLRPALLRFAALQLRDMAAAEDAVQEALVAVLESLERFAGRSSLRTYVTGILKFTIVDALRRKQREPVMTFHDDSEEELVDVLFRPDGHTVSMPVAWGDPEQALQEQDFFRVMEACLDRLPPNTTRIFLMREWLEMETGQICHEMGISSTNVWTMLYRARLRLRECLDQNWFGKRPA